MWFMFPQPQMNSLLGNHFYDELSHFIDK